MVGFLFNLKLNFMQPDLNEADKKYKTQQAIKDMDIILPPEGIDPEKQYEAIVRIKGSGDSSSEKNTSRESTETM